MPHPPHRAVGTDGRDTSVHAPLLHAVAEALAREAAAAPDAAGVRPLHAERGPSCSNELTQVRCSDGRTLMVKRGRYPWDGARFRASRLAADLLRRRTGVIAPRHVDVGPELGGRAVEVYWRLELPTLRERWPTLLPHERERALRSWGALLRRVHKVRLAGHGALARAERGGVPLAAFLDEELEVRLAPSVTAWWPAAVAPLRQLGGFVGDVADRVGDAPGVLLHNDPHFGNVLCEPHGRGFRCGGVLDLEAAMAGPPESDLAHVQVLHGPLLGAPLHGAWFEQLLRGYGTPVDPVALAFFRGYHLLNLGLHAAMRRWSEHAAAVAAQVATECATIGALVRGAPTLRVAVGAASTAGSRAVVSPAC